LLLVALVFRQPLLSLDLGVVDGRRGGLELLLELGAALLELGAMRLDVVELALQRADCLGALPHEGKGLAIGGVKARDDVGCVQVVEAYPGEVRQQLVALHVEVEEVLVGRRELRVELAGTLLLLLDGPGYGCQGFAAAKARHSSHALPGPERTPGPAYRGHVTL